LPEYPLGRDKSAVLVLQERVSEAIRIAHMQVKEEQRDKKFAKRDRIEKPDDEESAIKNEMGGKGRKKHQKGR
jgi:ATP-dependent RNA helicase DDX47/RRP3